MLRNPSLINHSRWLTTTNRILCLHVVTRSPSDELKTLVTFIVTVYAPAWFEIKNTPSCKDGAQHVHSAILKSRYLTDELKKVVDPVIQRNSFFSHPENLLLAMFTNERSDIRKFALRRILISRKQKRTRPVRSFCTPVINFEATSYIDMIDWQKTPITEPPIVMDINNNTLLTLIREEDTPRMDLSPSRKTRQIYLSTLGIEIENAKTGHQSPTSFVAIKHVRQFACVFPSKICFLLLTQYCNTCVILAQTVKKLNYNINMLVIKKFLFCKLILKKFFLKQLLFY